MHRVLVPVDESEDRARRQASYVASLPAAASEVEAIVVFVREADYKGAPEMALEDVESAMTALSVLGDAGVTCEGRLVKGMIAQTILDTAETEDVGTIVMGGRKRSGVSKVVLGSVTQDVILAADRAVAVVG